MKCPNCAEEILDDAKICKHCGRPTKGGSPLTLPVAFAAGFVVAAIGIKSAWGPAYSWSSLAGIIAIVGIVVGGVAAGIARMMVGRA